MLNGGSIKKTAFLFCSILLIFVMEFYLILIMDMVYACHRVWIHFINVCNGVCDS